MRVKLLKRGNGKLWPPESLNKLGPKNIWGPRFPGQGPIFFIPIIFPGPRPPKKEAF